MPALNTIARTTTPHSAENVAALWKWFSHGGPAARLCESHEALRLQYERLRDQTAAKLTAVLAVAEETTDEVAAAKLRAILRS